MIDHTDPDVVYSAGFYGRISRRNMATGESESIVPEPEHSELAEPPFEFGLIYVGTDDGHGKRDDDFRPRVDLDATGDAGLNLARNRGTATSTATLEVVR